MEIVMNARFHLFNLSIFLQWNLSNSWISGGVNAWYQTDFHVHLTHWGLDKTDDILETSFRSDFCKSQFCLFISISPRNVPDNEIDNLAAMGQVMAWAWGRLSINFTSEYKFTDAYMSNQIPAC